MPRQPASRIALSRWRVFDAEPEPSSTSVARLARGGDDLGRALGEDRALGAGRVVLGQLGDPLKELGAALVVEVLRRQLLRLGREADADVARHRRAAVGVEVDLDRDLGLGRRHASLAQRMPAKIWRRWGRSQLRKLGRMTLRVGRPGGAPQHLVLVAEEDLRVLAVGERLKAGVGEEVRGGPLPDLTDALQAGPGGLPLVLVGSRLPAQRAKASASSQETWTTGASGSTGSRRPIAVRSQPLDVALPVHRRLGAGLLHERDIRRIGDRGSIDLEGGELDRVAGALVVVGEAPRRRADLVRAGGNADGVRARGRRLGRGPWLDRHRLIAVDHLQELQHRLVVLVLVGEQHLVDEAAAQQGVLGVLAELDLVEHLERALAHVGEVGAQLGVAQDRQLAAGPARVLDRVVEAAELAVQRLAAADRLHQPQLLEVGDVAEVPGERAEDRRVDPVELLVVERLDQLQGPLPRLGETLRDRFLGAGRHLGGDAKTLQNRSFGPFRFGVPPDLLAPRRADRKRGLWPDAAIRSSGIRWTCPLRVRRSKFGR